MIEAIAPHPIRYADGSVPAEIEETAKASFAFDNAGPVLEWDSLDEETRSFHRELVVTILASWLQNAGTAMSLGAVKH